MALSQKERIDFIRDYAKKEKFSPAFTAGLLGNIERESSFNPFATNKKEGSYGFFQYYDAPVNQKRIDAFMKFMKEKFGGDPKRFFKLKPPKMTDIEEKKFMKAQLDFAFKKDPDAQRLPLIKLVRSSNLDKIKEAFANFERFHKYKDKESPKYRQHSKLIDKYFNGKPDSEKEVVKKPKPRQVSKPSKDSKPFAQAFKEAREEGKREFTWRGKRYLTLEKGESMDEFEEKFKFVDDQKFDNVEEFERSKDEDMAKAQQQIIEEAKQPKQEIKAEDIKLEQTIPMDQSVPFGVFAQGQPEFEMAEEQEKDKLMMAAEGGEVNYQEGGEVNVPQFLRRPEDDMQEEEFKLQDVTQMDVEEPDPFPKRDRSPDFQGVREFQLSQMSIDDLMNMTTPGVGRPSDVNRELSRRKKQFGGMSLKRLAELDRDQKQREEAKRQKEEANRQKREFEKISRTKVDSRSQRELDESELRKALDDSIKAAEKAAITIDPKRFYKKMSTFDKIVGLVGLAAGAYGALKYGGPNHYLGLIDKEIKEDIELQKLDGENAARKLAASKFKVAQIAKKLAMSTRNENQKIKLLDIFQNQRAAGVKELKKRLDQKDLQNVNFIVNTRGITDEELSKFDSRFDKLKLRDSMIKGRNGLNYFVRGGRSNVNKVKAYLADAQDSIDGLNDLYGYFDKISIVDQAVPIFSVDAAEAQSLRDRLVGKLRIEFFGPGVMTDSERAQAKRILGDPNALLTTDAREKPKILKLIMKLNYGVRDKLRRDGVAFQKTPNDLRIDQILERRGLQDNAKNRRQVIDGLIQAEIQAQKAGKRPGTIWNMNEPLPV
jgi:hypothetical protein